MSRTRAKNNTLFVSRRSQLLAVPRHTPSEYWLPRHVHGNPSQTFLRHDAVRTASWSGLKRIRAWPPSTLISWGETREEPVEGRFQENCWYGIVNVDVARGNEATRRCLRQLQPPETVGHVFFYRPYRTAATNGTGGFTSWRAGFIRMLERARARARLQAPGTLCVYICIHRWRPWKRRPFHTIRICFFARRSLFLSFFLFNYIFMCGCWITSMLLFVSEINA